MQEATKTKVEEYFSLNTNLGRNILASLEREPGCPIFRQRCLANCQDSPQLLCQLSFLLKAFKARKFCWISFAKNLFTRKKANEKLKKWRRGWPDQNSLFQEASCPSQPTQFLFLKRQPEWKVNFTSLSDEEKQIVKTKSFLSLRKSEIFTIRRIVAWKPNIFAVFSCEDDLK